MPHRVVKTLLKRILRRYNYVVSYYPPDVARGIDLGHDLAALVDCERPVCLDVGANCGQSIELFQRVLRRPTIHAFEPSSAMFQVLKRKSYGPSVRLHPFALGAEEESREFSNLSNSCLSSFLDLDRNEYNPFNDIVVAEKEIVEVKTVDWFVNRDGIACIDLLKVDTQGFDLRVLLGAADAFRRGIVRNVLIELNFVRLYERQDKATTVMDFLTDRGLHLVEFYEKAMYHNVLGWCTALFTKGRP